MSDQTRRERSPGAREDLRARMARKKPEQSKAALDANLRDLFARITRSDTVPPPATFLELGGELEQAGLRYFINGALPAGNIEPNHFTRNLVYTACRCHWTTEAERLALGDASHVGYILKLIEERPGFWPFVRDQLKDFSGLVLRELDRKAKAGIAPESGPDGAAAPEAELLPEMLSATALAEHLKASAKRVGKFLERYRKKYPDCFIEVDCRRVNEPEFLYRVKDVITPLKQALAKVRK